MIWTLLQAATGTGAQDPWTGLTRVTGPFVHPSVLAKFLVVCCLILASAVMWSRGGIASRAWALAGFGATVGCLGLTYTRAAWGAAALGLAYLIARKKARLLPLFGIVGVVAIMSIPSVYARVSDLWNTPPPAPGAPDNSLAWRVSYWNHLLPMAKKSPFNGRGFDTIPITGGQELAAHNIWVQTIVELGAVGLICLFAVVVSMSWMLHQNAKLRFSPGLTYAAAAVSLSMLAMSASENLLNETTTLWYLACIFTCGTRASLRISNDRPSERTFQ